VNVPWSDFAVLDPHCQGRELLDGANIAIGQ
jgi:hypothetical protein